MAAVKMHILTSANADFTESLVGSNKLVLKEWISRKNFCVQRSMKAMRCAARFSLWHVWLESSPWIFRTT